MRRIRLALDDGEQDDNDEEEEGDVEQDAPDLYKRGNSLSDRLHQAI